MEEIRLIGNTGEIWINRIAIRQEALARGMSWRQVTREAFFHEVFHRGTYQIEKAIDNLISGDPYLKIKGYKPLFESASEGFGRFMASRRRGPR